MAMRYSEKVRKRINKLKGEVGVRRLSSRLTKAGYPAKESTVAHWVNGRCKWPLDALPFAAKVLGVDFYELLPHPNDRGR